jgi:DNA-binding CsgD family transcriptional regulator
MPVKRLDSDKIEIASIEMLTEAQLACVRLVPKGPSKVIAKELGISHHTVDDHIREAMRRLGVTTRYDAAARVAAWDAAYPQGLGTQAEPLANTPQSAMIEPSTAMPATALSATPRPIQSTAVREERAEYSTANLRQVGLARLTQYWLGSLFDDLTGPNRLRGTLTLALILSVIVLVLVGVGNTVQTSLQSYSVR